MIEYEKAVLCAVLEQKECLDLFAPSLVSEDFVNDIHKRIWSTLKELKEKHGEASAVAIAEALPGDIEYITALRDYLPSIGVFSTRDIETWIEKVKDRSKLRTLKKRIDAAWTDSYAETASRIIEVASDPDMDAGDFRPLSQYLPEFDRKLAGYLAGRNESCLSTGFRDVDDRLGGGLPLGNVTILGGRVGVGKTAFAWQVVVNVLRECHRRGDGSVGFVSMDMRAEEFLERGIWAEAKVDGSKVRRGDVSQSQLDRVLEARQSLEPLMERLKVYDKRATSDFLRYQTMRMMQTDRIRLLVVDFAELVADDKASEVNRIAGIYRNLRELAKSTNVPVLVLSQLNRDVERDMYSSYIPGSDNLKLGGEDVASTILLLYYPFRYQQMGKKLVVPPVFEYQTIDETDSSEVREQKLQANKGRLYLIVAKSRFGGSDPIKLNFVPEWAYITDYDPESEKVGVVRLVARKHGM